MTEQQVKVNPLIEKMREKMPGVVVRLPSKGAIYEKGVLDDSVEDGEVTVYPMRLLEELKMKSPDSILQGTAISETIQYCVPQVLQPTTLAPEDVDYLLTAIKKSTHGPTIKFKDACMKLDTTGYDATDENVLNEMEERDRTGIDSTDVDSIAQELDDASGEDKKKAAPTEKGLNINNMGETSDVCEFSVSLDYFLNNVKEINYEQYKENCVFDFMGLQIEIHPITFKSYKDISIMELKSNKDMTEDQYLAHISKMSDTHLFNRIKRVDETFESELIMEWITSLSLKERTEIFEKIYAMQDWGIDFEYNLKCQTCGMSKKTNQSQINPIYFFLT